MSLYRPIIALSLAIPVFSYLPPPVFNQALQAMWGGPVNHYCTSTFRDSVDDAVTAARLLESILVESCAFLTSRLRRENAKFRPIHVTVVSAAALQEDEFIVKKYVAVSNYGRRCLNAIASSNAFDALDMRQKYQRIKERLRDEFGILVKGTVDSAEHTLLQADALRDNLLTVANAVPWHNYVKRFANKDADCTHSVAGTCSEDLAEYSALADGMEPFLLSTVVLKAEPQTASTRMLLTKQQCAKCHCSWLLSRRYLTDYVPFAQSVVYDALPTTVSSETLHNQAADVVDVFRCWMFMDKNSSRITHSQERQTCPGCQRAGRNQCLWEPTDGCYEP